MNECEFTLQIMVSSDSKKDVKLHTVLNNMIGISMKALFKLYPKKVEELFK